MKHELRCCATTANWSRAHCVGSKPTMWVSAALRNTPGPGQPGDTVTSTYLLDVCSFVSACPQHMGSIQAPEAILITVSV